jgi:hypothetical protein
MSAFLWLWFGVQDAVLHPGEEAEAERDTETVDSSSDIPTSIASSSGGRSLLSVASALSYFALVVGIQ